MSTFPAVIPSTRTHTPGTYPVSSYAATSGSESRLRHGNRIVGQQLTLSYDNITEAEWLQLRAHYLAHEPIRRSFNLPAAVLDGESSDQFEAEGYSWIYAGQPDTDDTQPDIHTVAITIERIPEPAPEGWPLTSLPAISTTAGRVARILYGRILSGQAASLTATGQAGQLRHAKVIRGQAAAFITTGQAASLLHGKVGWAFCRSCSKVSWVVGAPEQDVGGRGPGTMGLDSPVFATVFDMALPLLGAGCQPGSPAGGRGVGCVLLSGG
jgi:hypothetical protein